MRTPDQARAEKAEKAELSKEQLAKAAEMGDAIEATLISSDLAQRRIHELAQNVTKVTARCVDYDPTGPHATFEIDGSENQFELRHFAPQVEPGEAYVISVFVTPIE